MSSAIAAGTTAGTAISFSGDTSGQLVLQTNGTTTAVTISTGQVVTLAQPLPVASGGSGVTTSTGTGAVVLSTSPALTTPALGTPASGVLTNCTGAVVAALSTASGSAPSYSARAWVNFNGQGTVAIRASGNVSSITDNGTGDYTVNFTTAMSDANYAVSSAGGEGGTTGMGQRVPSIGTVATSSVRIASIDQNAGYADPPYCCISIFR